VKANLARFTLALALLATIAYVLAAGVKWAGPSPEPLPELGLILYLF
jgi:hypothetical protein